MAQEHHCEASFASKLVATLNPQCPVLDSLVLRVMRTHLGDHGSSEGKWTLLRQGSLESRIERALIVYGCLTAAVDDILGAADFTKLIKLFDISYGQYPLTATKKAGPYVVALRRNATQKEGRSFETITRFVDVQIALIWINCTVLPQNAG
jgi:hypothetical protein